MLRNILVSAKWAPVRNEISMVLFCLGKYDKELTRTDLSKKRMFEISDWDACSAQRRGLTRRPKPKIHFLGSI